MILSGTPFAADPLAGLWNPPFWLLVLSPTAAMANGIVWLHLLWAGWGAWILAKSEVNQGQAPLVALAAAAAFSGMPKLLGHVGLGHIGLVSAVSWTPWIILLWRRAIASSVAGVRRWAFRSMLAGGALGCAFLADPRWIIPAGLLATLSSLWQAMPAAGTARVRLRSFALAGFTAVASCLGVCAVLWVPLLEFYRLSTRHLLTSAEATLLSLPAKNLIGLLIPNLGGWPEWLVYPGIVVLMLTCVGIASPSRTSRFWGVVVVLGLLLALGSNTPIYPALVALVPGMSALRVPARWLLVSGLGLAMLSSAGLSQFASPSQVPVERKRSTLIVMAIALLSVLLASGLLMLRVDPGIQKASLGAAILAALCAIVLCVVARRSMRRGWVIGSVMMLMAADLVWVNSSLIKPLPMQRVVDEAEQATTWAEDLGAMGRSFSPTYALPQQIGALQRWELAEGVDPMQLAAYWDYMAGATGFDSDGYSVTLPPYPEGDPSAPWEVRIDGEALGLLAVTRVVSNYPVRGSGLDLISARDGLSLYAVSEPRPYAWVAEDAGDPLGAWRLPERLSRTPNVLSATAEGPGMLVFSEIQYPGWSARVDGAPTEVETVAGLLRGVRLSPGRHEIVLRFRPVTVYAGAAVTLLTLACLALLWGRR
jgi:hypothetical protein